MKNKHVHKKARRRDIWISYLIIGFLLIFLGFLSIHILDLNETISDLPLVGIASAFMSFLALLWQVSNLIASKKVIVDLSLTANLTDDNVILTSIIKNIGSKSIYPHMVNLYIDDGVLIDGIYQFDRIIEHPPKGKGEFYCKLAHHYRDHDVYSDKCLIDLPKTIDCETFCEINKYCVNLRQLSFYSLEHIMPGESFREDTVIKINKPGIYRAILYYSDKNWKDCSCRSVVFEVKKQRPKRYRR